MQDQDHRGLFIVLEGADGSGKTTQIRLLAERLKAVGYEVDAFDFPRYDEQSSYFVKRYLNGDYGEAASVSPYTASLFYALDRYEAAPEINQALKRGAIVLANRFVGSNMAHQGSKFTSEAQQRGFFVWAESLEFQLLGIPRPTLNIYLKVPPKVSFELIAQKPARSYTNKIRDGHEKNLEHLERSSATYDLLTKLFPKDFKEIACSPGDQMLDITEISDRVWEIIKPLLPPNPPNPAKSVVLNLSHADKTILGQPSSTNFKSSNSSSLSLNFANSKLRINDLSLAATGFLVGSSGLAANWEVNWTKAKTVDGCHYYVPPDLPPGLEQFYKRTIEKIAELYIKMRQSIADDGSRSDAQRALMLGVTDAVVPLSAFSSAELGDDVGSVKSAVEKLSTTSPKLSEIADLAKRLSDLASKLNNHSSNRAPGSDTHTKPQAIEEIVKNMAQSRLPQTLSGSTDMLKLIDFWPRNEFDLLTDSLYPYSNLSRSDLAAELDKWSYLQKTEALTHAILDQPESLISEVHYRFDITADRLKLQHLLRNNLIQDLKQQAITPRYGYEVPELIEHCGLEDPFVDCFDLSLELYSKLQTAGYDFLAGYAMLLGHRVRWQFSIAANSWRAYLNSSKISSGPHHTFMKLLGEKIFEVHPQLAKALFSNQPASVPRKEIALNTAKESDLAKKTLKKPENKL